MAIFRKIHVDFWEDTFVYSLTPEKKYFYLYLLTNSKTKQCGIYEITIGKMCSETGYNQETIEKLLQYFTELDKIKFSKETSELAIKNWKKYNDSTSPKVRSCIEKELLKVKSIELINYCYPH